MAHFINQAHQMASPKLNSLNFSKFSCSIDERGNFFGKNSYNRFYITAESSWAIAIRFRATERSKRSIPRLSSSVIDSVRIAAINP
jgi:hypothetical protein